jgi:protein phosphatase
MTLHPDNFEVDELEAALEDADLPDQATLDQADFNPVDSTDSADSKEMPLDDMPTIVLPMQLSMLEDSARTDVGQQREHNEDFFSLSTDVSKSERPSGRFVQAKGLYVLCDGMGGHAGGEVASQLAVETLQNFFRDYWASDEGLRASRLGQLPPSTVIREGVRLANQSIFDRNQADARMGNGRMGTTLVVMLLCNTSVAIAHVGDSRAYRYTRKRGLEQVTVDHEVGQREIQRGVDPEIAYGRPDAYQLTQALGPRDENFVEPDLTFMELAEDTLLLLASDGLTDNDLLENHMMSHVDPMMSSQMNLDQGVRQLVDLANEVNGHDNITVIAIRAKVRPNLDQLR